MQNELEKRKNDEETEEGWVQCDVCDCWVHQICGLFNKGRNKEETPYVCPMCLLDGAHTHHLLAHMLPCNDLPHSLLGALQWSLKCPGYETLPTSRAVQLCKNTWLGMRIWGAVTHAPRKWWCACSPDAISDPGWQRELIGVVAGCRAEAGPAEGNCGAPQAMLEAKDLQRCDLSDYLENRVAGALERDRSMRAQRDGIPIDQVPLR